MTDQVLSLPVKSTKRHFLSDLNFYMLFWFFMFGSIGGFIYEGILSVIKTGGWTNHSATIWGPFCIVYGAGAIAMYALSYILRGKNIVVQFITYSITGSIVEYIFSLSQELIFGSVSWDYSDHFLNIGGRISLMVTIVWGFLGICFANFIFPPIKRLLLKMKGNIAFIITWILIIFMIVNFIATSITVVRWKMRQLNNIADTKIEQIIDRFYGDERMKEIFSNMCFIEIDKVKKN